jgi:5'-phosphate synthase pdxT subunit
VRIGVLALQGAFREHILTFEALGASASAIRLPGQLEGLDALVIPGGESTAIAKLMRSYGFYSALRERHGAGMAIWGTCAGAILLATHISDAAADQEPLGLMDMTIRRNAYGRQVDSFEVELDIARLDGSFTGVFIRAPWIESVGEAGEVLARHDGRIVAARQGDLMATTFHPELTGDPRVHRLFLEYIVGSR